jgi:hypothetical protein
MRRTVICVLLRSRIFFPHYLIICDFKKTLLTTKCVFWFSLQILSEIFLILRRNGRVMIKKVLWSSCKIPFFLSDFNYTWLFVPDFSPQIFEKSSNTKFHENSFRGSLDFACGRVHMTKLTVAFRNFAKSDWKCNHPFQFFRWGILGASEPVSERCVSSFNFSGTRCF